MIAKIDREAEVLFVAHLFPASIAKKILSQKISPIQTQKFGTALLEAITEGISNRVEVMSVVPLLDFPQSEFVIAPGGIWRTSRGVRVVMMPYINIVILKHISRFLVTFAHVLIWSIKNIGKKRIIVMHGVQSCKLWGTILGQGLVKAIVLSYITDNIGLPQNWEGPIRRGLRNLDIKLMKSGLQKVSGVIAMTPWLSESLAPEKPFLLINTILNSDEGIVNSVRLRNMDGAFRVVYAGGVNKDYGIESLVQVFKLTNRTNWRLVIAGSGDQVESVRSSCKSDSRIEFNGMLGPEDLLRLYESADVLINPRPVSNLLARMAFPSKIVEYLRTGKPVVTTPLPSFDLGIKQHLVISRSDKPADLLKSLEDVASWPADKIEEWGRRAKDYVHNNLTPIVQGRKINDFIRSLQDE